MKLPFGADPGTKKASGVADAINRLLYGLVYRCTTGAQGEILDRYYVGVIGYGSDVGSALGGQLAGRGLVPISEIGKKPLRVDTRTKKISDGAGGVIETSVKFPVWLETVADARTTRMCKALTEARKTIEDFVTNCPRAYPPVVINITDGEAKDGNPEPHANALKELATEDGSVLLFNTHISSSNEKPIEFPVSETQLPDKFARLLFRMSSPLPPKMIADAQSMEIQIADGARGFVFNADLVSVIQLLEIGTRTSS
ncbi:MAG: hypothetical protein ACC628_21665 [Pirellulaceae bacterium]